MLIRLLTSVVCLALAALALGLAGGTAHILYRQHATAAWPATWAMVTQSEIRRKPGLLGVPADRHTLSYEYTVAGRPYVGNRWTTYFPFIDTTRNTPTARANATPLLEEVRVHYDPVDPQRAVVSPGVRNREWAVGGTLALAMTILALRLLRDAWRTLREVAGVEDHATRLADQHDRAHQLLPSSGPSSTDSSSNPTLAPTARFRINTQPTRTRSAAHRSPRAVAEHILDTLNAHDLDDLPDLRADRTRAKSPARNATPNGPPKSPASRPTTGPTPRNTRRRAA